MSTHKVDLSSLNDLQYENLLVVDGGILDVDAASGGQFGPDPQAVFEHWDEFQAWASTVSGPTHPLDPQALGPPVPRPRQVFAIGMNCGAHAAKGGVEPPVSPSAGNCPAAPSSCVPRPLGSAWGSRSQGSARRGRGS